VITAKDKKILNGYGKYLDEGIDLSQSDHEIREQAYKSNTIIEEREIEAGNTDMPLREFDMLEIFRALSQWGNKQEKGFWDKQTSY